MNFYDVLFAKNTSGGGGGSPQIVEADYIYFSRSVSDAIMLPFTVDADYKITVDFEMDDYPSNNMAIIGNDNDANNVHLTVFNSNYYCSNGPGEVHFSSDFTGRHVFVCGEDGNKNTFDGRKVSDYTPTTSANNHLIIGRRTGASYSYKGKIYSYKIESISTGELIFCLKPVKVVSEGVEFKAIMDTVSKEIYYPFRSTYPV